MRRPVVLVMALVGALLSAAPDPADAAVTFVVNRTGNAADLNLADAVCDTTTANGSQCTLRAAIQEANDTAGADTINFSIGTDGGLKVISPGSQLPAITEAVTINGYSQPGASANTLAVGNNAVLRIRLNGANGGANGLRIFADDSLVKGLAISGFAADGIRVVGSDNKIEGNFIGTNAAGTTALGNGGHGVSVNDGSTGNLIGRTNTKARNLISGNGASGVSIAGSGATGNAVRGNYLGTNAAGTAALGNVNSGVAIGDAAGNTIGGTGASARNLISGNGDHGVQIFGPSATGNVVLGNFIGTDVTGTLDVRNLDDGVIIGFEANGNTVGGAQAGARNLISGNGSRGVAIAGFDGSDGNVVAGNFIGTDVSGTGPLGNEIGVSVSSSDDNTIGGAAPGSGNVISGNFGDGIEISDSSGTNVLGNLIGTTPGGDVDVGNGGHGVTIDSAPDNIIGGTAGADGNVISGNGRDGVHISGGLSSSNLVVGNHIGTDRDGVADLGNDESGVVVDDAEDNTIGGTADGAGNLISGNAFHGVHLLGTGTESTDVQGNLIGTDATGAAAIRNDFSGVLIEGSANNTVGGTAPGAGNVISGNIIGVEIREPQAINNKVQGNLIGTDAAGSVALRNVLEGVFIFNGSNNTIGGTASGAGNVISGNGGSGVSVLGSTATGNVVAGNLIGTDASGSVAVPNDDQGVLVRTSDNTIGGTTGGARNVISGNDASGVRVEGFDGGPVTGTVIQGNFIGTDASGTAALGNFAGISLVHSQDTVVGGTVAAARNVVSANGNNGISVVSSPGTTVQGNRVGTKADGTGDLGNGVTGVAVGGTSTGVTVGGTVSGAGNAIVNSGTFGVTVLSPATGNLVQGNSIASSGTDGVFVSGDDTTITGNIIVSSGRDGVRVQDLADLDAQGNRILSNQILNNARLGINLAGGTQNAAGVTSNDTDDPDAGPNRLQNFPVLTSALRSNTTGVTVISGSLNSTPSQQFTIQVFLAAGDASNHGEAIALVGATTVTTNANGDKGFSVSTAGLALGQQVTATATNTTTNDTSEFALNVTVTPGP